jgi:hypothetical protein
MSDPAIAFAAAFDVQFRKYTATHSYKEVPLFQSLHKALASLSNRFDVAEFHGNAHQVEFTGNGSYARTNARCELSDLMIISFSPSKRCARLTFLQAKSERAKVQLVHSHNFSANLEQWYLLENRPFITGVGANFNPPNDLLSSSLLPSVGSFAFFYKDSTGAFQIYYASASYMIPPGVYSQKNGRLRAKGRCMVQSSGGYPECLAASGNCAFAESLFRLEIGTPIDFSIPQTTSTRRWLSSVLRSRIEGVRGEHVSSGLVQELLHVLGSDGNEKLDGSFGTKHLIIIKTDKENPPNV